MTTAVIVEDDRLASMALAELLEGEGFSVRCFPDATEALSSCLTSPPDILIADWCVPGAVSSKEFVEQVKTQHPRVRVIFITGYAAHELPEDLIESECFTKPLNYDRFLQDLRGARWSIGDLRASMS